MNGQVWKKICFITINQSLDNERNYGKSKITKQSQKEKANSRI